MKKYIALLITLTAIFIMSTDVAAFNDISDPHISDAVSILSSLDIVNGYSDGGYHPDSTLTRAELSKLITVLLGETDKLSSYSQKTLFSDVTSVHWGASYINLVYTRGLLKGYGDGKFGPDDKVTYEQLLTVMLRLLDYSDSDVGTVYPDDYINMANKLRLTEGVEIKVKSNITRGDTAILLVNLITANTKSGAKYYKKMSSSTIENAVVLASDSMSDSGEVDCVKLYAGGKTVWYGKSTDIPKSFIGVSGTALLDSEEKIICFIPDSNSFSAVSGILVVNSQRSSEGTLPYETVMYVGDKKTVFPRASTISAESIGHYGTLLLDGNGYATAFISDESDIYSVIKNAILISESAVSDLGRKDNARFYINGNKYYDKAENCAIYKEDIGKSGIILLDQDNNAVAFFPDEKNSYTVLSGVVTETDKNKTALAINGEIKWYSSYVSTQPGNKGTALINSHGEMYAFLPEDTVDNVYSDAILVYTDVESPDDGSDSQAFIINGGLQYFECDVKLSDEDIFKSGTLIIDTDGVSTEFYPDSNDKYTSIGGILIGNNDGKLQLITDVEQGEIKEYKYSFDIKPGETGQCGTLLLSDNGVACAFFYNEKDERYTITESGVLISTDTVAQDGYTLTAKFYSSGRVLTYKASELLDDKWELSTGRLLINSDSEAVLFMEEDDYSTYEYITQATATELVGYYESYSMMSEVTVIVGTGISVWKNVYSTLEGKEVRIFFDSIGDIDFIYAEK